MLMDNRLWRKSVARCQVAFGTCFCLNESATWMGGKQTCKVEVHVDPSRAVSAEGSLGRWLHRGTLVTTGRVRVPLWVPRPFRIHLKGAFHSLSDPTFIPFLWFTTAANPEHHLMLNVWAVSMTSWPWPRGSSKHWKQAIPVCTYMEHKNFRSCFQDFLKIKGRS